MPDPPRRYNSAAGFQHALKSALTVQHVDSRKSTNQLLREFYLQRFLARIFDRPDHRWVLKGGTNLLARFPSVARHSQDIDLLYHASPQPEALAAGVADLRAIAGTHPELDPLTFTVGPAVTMSGGAGGLTLRVTATFEATEVARFPVDVVADLPLTAETQQQRPEPIASFGAVSELPIFTLYPLADQVADKLCAMYERHGPHGTTPSSRYRDLVDLLIIITEHPLEAATLVRAIASEVARRGLVLPESLEVPGPGWARGYPDYARRSGLPRSLGTLTPALAAAASCLDPILSGATTSGMWDPGQHHWTATGS